MYEDTTKIILSKVPQEAIMQKYFPHQIRLGEKYRNPFRADKNAGCSFCYKNGTLYFVDFALTKKAHNCFTVCMLKNNCSFSVALRIINEDFNLGIYGPRGFKSKPQVYEKIDYDFTPIGEEVEEAKIKVLTQKFTDEDLLFFSKGGITEKTLIKHNVKSCLRSWINNYLWHTYTKKDIQFRYTEGFGKYKIYRPYATNKNYKFRSNYDESILEGFNELPENGELLFITKSKKDIMTLDEIGYSSVAVKSETTLLVPEQIANLKERFTNIYVWFDNDNPGVQASIKLTTLYNLDYFNIPKGLPKDPFGFVSEYSQTELIQLIKTKI